eukprot:136497_1
MLLLTSFGSAVLYTNYHVPTGLGHDMLEAVLGIEQLNRPARRFSIIVRRGPTCSFWMQSGRDWGKKTRPLKQIVRLIGPGPDVSDHPDEKAVSIGPRSDPSDLHVEVDAQDEEIAHECQRVYVSKEMRMEL